MGGALTREPANDKEAKQKEFLQWGAVAVGVIAFAGAVYVLSEQFAAPRKRRPKDDGRADKTPRKPFTLAVTSPQDEEVKQELKRKLTGYKAAPPVTVQQIQQSVKRFHRTVEAKNWESLGELVSVVRKMNTFEDQFSPTLRLGAARIIHTFNMVQSAYAQQGVPFDMSNKNGDWTLALRLLRLNPDGLESQKEYEEYLTCKIDIYVQLKQISDPEYSGLFHEASQRKNLSKEMMFTLLNHSLILGDYVVFAKLYELLEKAAPGWQEVYRELSLQGAAIPDMQVMKSLLDREAPSSPKSSADLKILQYLVTSTHLKLSRVMGDDPEQVAATQEGLSEAYANWTEQESSTEGKVLIQGVCVTGVGLFPDTPFSFSGIYSLENRTVILEKVSSTGDVQRYQLSISSSDSSGELWSGLYFLRVPRGESNNAQSSLPTGVICEFETRLHLRLSE